MLDEWTSVNLVITVVGFGAAVAGVGLNWGPGYALLVGGAVLFLAGALDRG